MSSAELAESLGKISPQMVKKTFTSPKKKQFQEIKRAKERSDKINIVLDGPISQFLYK